MDEVTRLSREISRKHYKKPSIPWTPADYVAMALLGSTLLLAVIALIATLAAMPLQP